MKISLGIGIGLNPTRRTAQIITRVSSPTFGPYEAGDTPEDEYTPGTYASSAGDIASIVPEWTINNVPDDGTTTLVEGDVVRLVSETVTDDADPPNERVFGYSGTAVVSGELPSGISITNLSYDQENNRISFTASHAGTAWYSTTAASLAGGDPDDVINAVGAEDDGSFAVGFGEVDEEILLPLTTAGATRYLNFVLVVDDEKSAVVALEFSIQVVRAFPTIINIESDSSTRKRLLTQFSDITTTKLTVAFRVRMITSAASRVMLRADGGTGSVDSIRIDTNSTPNIRMRVYDSTNTNLTDMSMSGGVTTGTWYSVIGAIDFDKEDLGSGIMAKFWMNGTTMTRSVDTTDKTLRIGASARHLWLPFTGTMQIGTWFWLSAGSALDPEAVAGSFFDGDAGWAERDILDASNGIISGVNPTHFITGNADEWNGLVNLGTNSDGFAKDGTFTEPDP